MQVRLNFEKKSKFVFSLAGDRLGVVQLYQLGNGWHGLKNESIPFQVNFISVNNVYLFKAASLEELKTWNREVGAYFQERSVVYISVREIPNITQAAEADSLSWFFNHNSFSMIFGLTDGEFFVVDGVSYKTGLLEGYKLKLAADIGSVKFTGLNLNLILSKISPIYNSLIGSYVTISLPDGTIVEKQYIENIVGQMSTIKITARDLRASLKSSVVNKNFYEKYWKTPTYPNDNNTVDKDTLKSYVSDGIGKVFGVPGQCLNGAAADKDEFRYYRFCFGYFMMQSSDRSHSGIEVEHENGWRELSVDDVDGTDEYTEFYVNGTAAQTRVVRIKNKIVIPTKEGTTAIDYEVEPRRVRFNGILNSRIPNQMTVRSILKYFVDRYYNEPYNDTYFNLEEIESELSIFDNEQVGIWFDKQIDFYKVIEQLQQANSLPWQLVTHEGRISARVMNPSRMPIYTLKESDIKNLYSLEYDSNGADYVSDFAVRYARTYSDDDLWLEYKDEATRQDILMTRPADIAGNVETLLANKEDAIRRFEFESERSKNIKPSIGNLLMNEKGFDKWRILRQYDIVNFDFSRWYPGLSGFLKWYIMEKEADFAAESVKLKIKAV